MSPTAGLDQLAHKQNIKQAFANISSHSWILLQNKYSKGKQQHIFNFLVDIESEAGIWSVKHLIV